MAERPWTRARTQSRWLALAILTTLGLVGRGAVAAGTLTPGKPVERIVEAKTTDAYDIPLKAGDFLRVRVEQLEFEIGATLVKPDSTPLLEAFGISTNNGGLPFFTVSAVIPAAGVYRLEIRSPIPRSPRYRLTLDQPHPATAADEVAAEASRVFHKATRFSTLARANPPRTEEYIRQAAEAYVEALALFTSLGDHEGEAGALLNLGWSYLRLNEYDQSEQFLDRAEEVWRQLGNVEAGKNVGLVKAQLEQNRRRANVSAQSAAALAQSRAEGDIAAQRDALSKLINVAPSNEEAIVYEKQLIELEPTPDTLAAAGYLRTIAIRYFQLHEFQTSIRYAERAASIYQEKGAQPKALGLTYVWLSNAYLQLGDNKAALRYAEQAAQQGVVSPNEVAVLTRSGQYDTAIRSVKSEISHFHDDGSSSDEARAWVKLAAIYVQLKQSASALECLDRAGSIWRWQLDRAPFEFLSAAGAQYQALGLPKKAVDLFEKYYAINRPDGPTNADQYSDFLREWGESQRDLGLLSDARFHIEGALAMYEHERAGVASPDLLASSFSKLRTVYEDYIGVLMRQHARAPRDGHDVEAFEASERARGQSLIAGLGDIVTRIRDDADPKLIGRERSLEDQLNQLALQRRPAAPEIQRITADLELVRGEIRRSSPRYSLVQPETLKLSDIRARVLEPGTMLLEYSLSDSGNSYLWAVTTDRLYSFTLPPRRIIDRAVRRVRESMVARETRPKETDGQREARIARADADYNAAAAELSRILLAPAAGLLHGQRLLVVADGTLASIPFAALPNPATKELLIASHEITRLPSASGLAELREAVSTRGPSPSRGIAVLADPVFDAADERLATGRRITAKSYPDTLQRSLNGMETALPRLAFSRVEAESIKSAASAGDVFLALDFNANRQFAINSALGRYRIVHFATHGLLRDDAPQLSGIVLSLVNAQGKPEDGFLRLHEIYNFHLTADLVVLSACQTALGAEMPGEGVLGLARGFMYAGAARVMASLWTVDDRATAELMGRFYRKLLSGGMSPAAALRAAQVEMQKTPRWASPYFWAAFELQGEWK